MKFAIKGQSDLYGIVRGTSLHVEVELKAPGKRLEPAQKAWQAWCKEWGIPHIVLTGLKEETVGQTVDRWITELEKLIAASTTVEDPKSPRGL